MRRRGVGIQAVYELELFAWTKLVLVFHYQHVVFVNCCSNYFKAIVREIVYIDSRANCTKL
jgi:hypothetical protein